MGNRAIVIFTDSKKSEFSPQVYLHWNGSDVPEWIEELKALMGIGDGDISYTAARFVGICHSHMEGNSSLGLYDAPKSLEEAKNASHGDKGVFLVNCDDFSFERFK